MLGDGALGRGGGYRVDRRGVQVGGGVGDVGDAEPREPGSDRAQFGRAGTGQPGAEPVIGAPQPAGGAALAVTLDAGVLGPGQAERPRSRGVDHPQGAAAVLEPDRALAVQAVEAGYVQQPGHVLAVADPAHPPVLVGRRSGERHGEHVRPGYLRGAALHRGRRRGHRVQVQVVVAEPGNQGHRPGHR